MSAGTIAVGVVAGFGSGMLASMVGIGGAVVTTPAIRFAGAPPLAAIGSTVPAILPGALSGAYRYHREGLIDRRAAGVCGASGVISAVAGGIIAGVVDARWLMVITSLIVLWSASSLIRSARRPESRHPPRETRSDGSSTAPIALYVGLGVAAGFLAGLLGVGGGIVLTPGLNLVAHLPVKKAIASSLAAVAMMSVASLATHVRLGHVDWAYALPLVVGVVPGAQVGARVTVASSDRQVRLTAGVVLGIVAVVYMGRELIGLMS